MKAGWRLALTGVGLVVAFGAAFGIAHALVPDSVVTAWMEQGGGRHGEQQGHDPAPRDPGSHGPESHDPESRNER